MATSAAVPQRILVYGVTGSGKSHAAQRLADIHRLPLVLADELAWKPGWQLHDSEPARPDEPPQAGWAQLRATHEGGSLTINVEYEAAWQTPI